MSALRVAAEIRPLVAITRAWRWRQSHRLCLGNALASPDPPIGQHPIRQRGRWDSDLGEVTYVMAPLRLWIRFCR